MTYQQYDVLWCKNELTKGWWPCQLLEVVDCLKNGELFLLYNVSLYMWPEQGNQDETIFIMHENLKPFQIKPQGLSLTKHMKKALEIARVQHRQRILELSKTSLCQQEAQTTSHDMITDESIETNTPSHQLTQKKSSQWLTMGIKRAVINRIYKELRWQNHMERSLAQDTAIEMEQQLVQKCNSIAEYKIRVSEQLKKLSQKKAVKDTPNMNMEVEN